MSINLHHSDVIIYSNVDMKCTIQDKVKTKRCKEYLFKKNIYIYFYLKCLALHLRCTFYQFIKITRTEKRKQRAILTLLVSIGGLDV